MIARDQNNNGTYQARVVVMTNPFDLVLAMSYNLWLINYNLAC